MNQLNQFNASVIEKYLDNELTAQEKLLLEKELKQNPFLYKEFRLRSEINKMLSDSAMLDLLDKLETIHHKHISEVKIKKPFFSIQKSWYAYAATVLILISSVTYVLLPKSYTSQELYSKYVIPYDIASNVRSASVQTDVRLVKALEYYEQQNYESAIALFEEILAKDSLNVSSNFYSGISYMQNKKFDPAKRSFNRVIQHDNNPYIEHAEWYLGFCYLMSNKEDKAIVQFQKIAKSNSYYRNKAKHLLRDLR
jgi:tetratricopeptide (TPR) repeat protein